MSGFALNLDLTLYFEDLRKYASVYVDPSKCKTVGDVENHIKTIFKLEDNICLTNKKFLIPRCESTEILLQYETLKVQKCDFYDHQIHKNKKSSPPCEHPALNLVQSDRTIDLSCRPKQRLKINNCKNRCVFEAPLTPFENGVGNMTQLTFRSDESIDICEVQSKCKVKTKKKKYDTHKYDEESGDESTANILDMSVNKIKKKNREDSSILVQQMNGENPFNSIHELESNQESSNEFKKKSKKKRKLLYDEETQLATNSFWENLVAEKGIDSKKRKIKGNYFENSDGLVKDLSLTPNNNLDEKQGSYQEETSIKKKPKTERKSNYNNNLNEDYIDSVNNYQPNSREDNSLTPKIDVNCCKDQVQKQSDKLISTENPVPSCFSFIEVSSLSSSKVSNDDQYSSSSNKVNCSLSCSEDKSLGPFENSSEKKMKRKRIRKHNKKKKREKMEFLSAIGPLLSKLQPPPEIKLSPSSSEVTKHIYFTEDDFIEEMKIPKSPPERSQSILQGNHDNTRTNENSTEDGTSHNTSRTDENKTDNMWQHDLLSLATHTSKPVIFYRSDKIDYLPQSTSTTVTPAEKSNKAPLTNLSESNNNIVKVASEVVASEVIASNVATFNDDDVSLNVTEEDSQATIKTVNPSSDSKKFKHLKSIVLTDYPIIDKVKAEDIILLKAQSEKNGSECSGCILAKVENAEHFPEKISLEILEGIEECDHLTRTENEEGFTIDLHWSDIIEPRLFYP